MSAAWIAGAALLVAVVSLAWAFGAYGRALDAEVRALRLERRVRELERRKASSTVVRIDGRRPTLPVEDRRRPR